MSQENNFIPSQDGYKTITPFQLFVKSNFPFIENTYESLDNYGLYCKIVEYLNNVIENENTVESNVTALYNAFVSLNNYVSDYFDNLDVQDEINNKLDEMATDGQLQPLINNIFRELNTKINRLASGSPSGIYNTYNDLVQDNPNHDKIYVVSDNGYWYYYSDNSNTWVSGGVYQASEDSEIVQELNLKINSLDDNFNISRNIANPLDIERETVYITPTNKRTDSSWSTLVVNVQPNETYTIWNCNPTYSWFTNESDENLGTIGISEGVIRTPNNCNVLKLSINNLTSNMYVVNGNVTNSDLYLSDSLQYFQIVESLSTDLKPIKDTIFYQYVNTENSNVDRYWTFANMRTAEGYLAYNPITVSPGVYTLYNAMGEFTYYKEGSTWHQLKEETGNQMNNQKTVLTLNEPTIFYITRNPIAYDTMLINSNITVTEYIEFGAFTSLVDTNKVENLVLEYLPKTYYVGENETYTKIKDAIQDAIQYENSIVYILPGIYDLIQEFGEEYLNSTNSERGIILKNNVHLIFAQGSKVLCNYTGNNSFIKQNFSAFNSFSEYSQNGIKKSGFIIEGLNIEASNIRYIVHDEKSGTDIPYTNIYKNCIMTFDNRNNNVFNTTQCIGGGLGVSGEIIIENCIFDSKQINTSVNIVPAVSYHNDSYTSQIPTNNNYHSNIVIKDNYFKGDYNTFRAGYIGVLTEITPCLVSNNNMGVEPILIAEQSSAPNLNMSLIKWNNFIRQ